MSPNLPSCILRVMPLTVSDVLLTDWRNISIARYRTPSAAERYGILRRRALVRQRAQIGDIMAAWWAAQMVTIRP
ncbi:hypothetical protein KGO5_04346 [Sinorhizobium sp. KGO-5]|jgi:hypothetical protein|nr:hypothetical protein KGO5_04346 [Sinorhizobium sp. KGO-5]